MRQRIVLASSSPRRQELLQLTNVEFTVVPSDVDEDQFTIVNPAVDAERLALMKALDVADRLSAQEYVVVGADTVVVADGLIMGKPLDADDAFRKLSILSGRTHQVITGVAVVNCINREKQTFHEVTNVTFRPMSPEEIRRYIATGEPMDKAGAYGIQGLGAVNIVSIEGDYFNVVGLPLAHLFAVLSQYGIYPW